MNGQNDSVHFGLGNRWIATLCAVLLLGTLVTVGAAAAQTTTAPTCGDFGYTGNGTADNPYEVENVSQLQCVGNDSTATSLSDSFELVSNIDASGTDQWNGDKGFDPIGQSNALTGAFDGNGNEISGLTINRTSTDSVGLFGGLFDATVGNLTVRNADVNGRDNVGILAGRLDSTSTVKKVAVEGTVNGSSNIGGLAGDNVGSIQESAAAATVNGSARRVGGLVGRNGDFSRIRNSYATGAVSGDTSVGGLMGTNGGTVTNSYATGNVSGNTLVGGLVGFNGPALGGEVSNSYATGAVSGGTAVGGLVGRNEQGSVTATYAAGTVSGDSSVGGLVGTDFGTLTDSYWDTEATNQSSATGDGSSDANGLTTSQLKGNDSLAGFDFGSTWAVVDNGTYVSYPYLQANAQSPEPGLQSVFAGGNGTSSNPYEITDWNDLNATREDLTANYTLVNDLNESTTGYDAVANASANGGKGFDPIGQSGEFTGSFDGNGNEISGLTINRTNTDSVGLFSVVGTGATVGNLTIRNANVSGRDNVGILAGEHVVMRTIENVTVEGTVNGTNQVGGLVGSNTGKITNSSSAGTVNGTDNVGGLVGENSGTVIDSYATVGIDGSEKVGGLVGFNNNGDIEKSYATGTVNGSNLVGGLVGRTSAGNITGSYATGDVNGQSKVGGLTGSNFLASDITDSYATGDVNGSNFVGGLVGENDVSTVTNSNATGDVNGSNNVGGLVGTNDGATVNQSYATGAVNGSSEVGGLVGQNTDREQLFVSPNYSATVSNTYATGPVTGSGTAIGGLVGNNTVANGAESVVNKSYATGEVHTDASATNVGGLVGANSNGATVDDAYWDTETTTLSSSAGIPDANGLTTGQLKGNDSLAGFAFAATWDVVNNATYISYPFLQDNPQTPAPGLEEINLPPTATDDTYLTEEGANLTVEAPGVLSNDEDPNDDPLSASLVSPPPNGTVEINTDGSFKYTPDAEFAGNDTFVYEAGDGEFTDTANVTIDVIATETDEDLITRREAGRGELNRTREPSRELGRGEERNDLYRDSGRNQNSSLNRRGQGR